MPRCVSRYADTAEVVPQDGKLHEDRPLLKHRSSKGFKAARSARDAVESTAKRAQGIGARLAEGGCTASRRLRRRAQDISRNIPTPVRSRRKSTGSLSDKRLSMSSDGTGSQCTFDDDESTYLSDVFEIGSDDDEMFSEDEEEQMWQTHPLEASPGQLNDALSTWGKPGEAMDKLKPLNSQVGTLDLGSPNPMRTLNLGSPNEPMRTLNLGKQSPSQAAPTSPRGSRQFYMGTPRDDSTWAQPVMT